MGIIRQSTTKWYPDWTSGDETCKNDGFAPEYMIDNESLWLNKDREDCCAQFFGYKLSDCTGTAGTSASTTTGKFFPDWEGDNKGCLQDNASHPAPQYMLSSKSIWFRDTLDACCKAHYGWMESECKGTSGSSAPGTNKWYIDWKTNKCVQDCAVANGSDCGGYADYFGRANLHNTKATCCKAHMSWDYRHCFE
jgi:hypothetical protein